jgi:hypothetical protein
MPKYVTIFGRKIPIKLCTKEQLDLIYKDAAGIWDPTTRTIYIDKNAPKKTQLYWLYHEMGHATKTFVGLDQILPSELQEVIVQSFATLIEDVLSQKGIFK